MGVVMKDSLLLAGTRRVGGNDYKLPLNESIGWASPKGSGGH